MKNVLVFLGVLAVLVPFVVILGGAIVLKVRGNKKGSPRRSSLTKTAVAIPVVAARKKTKVAMPSGLVQAMVCTNTGRWFRTVVLRSMEWHGRYLVLFPNGTSVWRRASQVRLIPAPATA